MGCNRAGLTAHNDNRAGLTARNDNRAGLTARPVTTHQEPGSTGGNFPNDPFNQIHHAHQFAKGVQNSIFENHIPLVVTERSDEHRAGLLGELGQFGIDQILSFLGDDLAKRSQTDESIIESAVVVTGNPLAIEDGLNTGIS